LKKPYSSPDLDLIRMDFSTVICAAGYSDPENVNPGVEEPIDDDDIG